MSALGSATSGLGSLGTASVTSSGTSGSGCGSFNQAAATSCLEVSRAADILPASPSLNDF